MIWWSCWRSRRNVSDFSGAIFDAIYRKPVLLRQNESEARFGDKLDARGLDYAARRRVGTVVEARQRQWQSGRLLPRQPYFTENDILRRDLFVDADGAIARVARPSSSIVGVVEARSGSSRLYEEEPKAARSGSRARGAARSRGGSSSLSAHRCRHSCLERRRISSAFSSKRWRKVVSSGRASRNSTSKRWTPGERLPLARVASKMSPLIHRVNGSLETQEGCSTKDA